MVKIIKSTDDSTFELHVTKSGTLQPAATKLTEAEARYLAGCNVYYHTYNNTWAGDDQIRKIKSTTLDSVLASYRFNKRCVGFRF